MDHSARLAHAHIADLRRDGELYRVARAAGRTGNGARSLRQAFAAATDVARDVTGRLAAAVRALRPTSASGSTVCCA